METKVIKSWKDVSISTYKQICKINEREMDSDLEKKLAVCALLNGINEDDIYAKSVAETRQLLNDMDWLFQPFTFDYKWHHKHLTINGVKCRMYQSIEELTMAQYLDFENFWADRDENQGRVLAVFIVPEGKQYNEGYDAVQFAQELEDTLSIQDWNSIAFFLLKQYLISVRCSVRYSVWLIQKMIWKEKDKTKKKELKEVRRELIRQLRSMR